MINFKTIQSVSCALIIATCFATSDSKCSQLSRISDEDKIVASNFAKNFSAYEISKDTMEKLAIAFSPLRDYIKRKKLAEGFGATFRSSFGGGIHQLYLKGIKVLYSTGTIRKGAERILTKKQRKTINDFAKRSGFKNGISKALLWKLADAFLPYMNTSIEKNLAKIYELNEEQGALDFSEALASGKKCLSKTSPEKEKDFMHLRDTFQSTLKTYPITKVKRNFSELEFFRIIMPFLSLKRVSRISMFSKEYALMIKEEIEGGIYKMPLKKLNFSYKNSSEKGKLYTNWKEKNSNYSIPRKHSLLSIGYEGKDEKESIILDCIKENSTILSELEIELELEEFKIKKLNDHFSEIAQYPNLKRLSLRIFHGQSSIAENDLSGFLIQWFSSKEICSESLEVIELHGVQFGETKNASLATALKQSKAFPKLQKLILKEDRYGGKKIVYERVETENN